MSVKNTGIALALEISEATKEAMFDFDTTVIAAEIIKDNPAVMDLLFKYTASLSASVATRLTHLLLTPEQLDGMMADIKMFDEIGE